MKYCPRCNRSYEDDALLFCLEDGESLVFPDYPSNLPQTMMSPPTPNEIFPNTNALQSSFGQPVSPYPSYQAQPHKQNYKILIAILGSFFLLILLMGGLGILYFVKTNSRQESLDKLFPEKVKNYKLEKIQELDESHKSYNTSDGKVAEYSSLEKNPKIDMMVLRYQSAADAKAGLQKLKTAWLKISNAPKLLEEGTVRKNGTVVGDKFVLGFETGKGVYWTNGSLLFTASGVGEGVLDFEKSFPH